MQIMMQKIKRTEARCAIFEKESYEKDRRIKVLEEKLHLYKKSNDIYFDLLVLYLYII